MFLLLFTGSLTGTPLYGIEPLMLTETKVGFGMRYRAANCSGCNRILVQRAWKKLKSLKSKCPYCFTDIGYIIIHWPGYVKRMESGATYIETAESPSQM